MILYDGLDKNIGNFVDFAPDCFSTPFFTPEYCEHLIKLSEECGIKEQDHGDYNLLIHNLEGGEEICKSWLSTIEEYIEPKIIEKYSYAIKYKSDTINYDNNTASDEIPSDAYESRCWNGYSVPFIKKYSKETQRQLTYHWDCSLLTIYMKLNDKYTGLTTVFPRQNWNNSNMKVGELAIWPSLTHPHYVEKIKSGIKYSFVGRAGILSPRNDECDNIRKLYSLKDEKKYELHSENLKKGTG